MGTYSYGMPHPCIRHSTFDDPLYTPQPSLEEGGAGAAAGTLRRQGQGQGRGRSRSLHLMQVESARTPELS
eukprot:scaffold257901_cov33-Tisochrysis_lutea.AAC.1